MQQGQQGVQTDATCNIQQCWELLANSVGKNIYIPDCKISLASFVL